MAATNPSFHRNGDGNHRRFIHLRAPSICEELAEAREDEAKAAQWAKEAKDASARQPGRGIEATSHLRFWPPPRAVFRVSERKKAMETRHEAESDQLLGHPIHF